MNTLGPNGGVPYNVQLEIARRWDKAVDAGSPISARNLSRQPVPYLSDAERLAQPMGQFQSWCGKLFTYSSEFIGWRYTKGLV